MFSKILNLNLSRLFHCSVIKVLAVDSQVPLVRGCCPLLISCQASVRCLLLSRLSCATTSIVYQVLLILSTTFLHFFILFFDFYFQVSFIHIASIIYLYHTTVSQKETLPLVCAVGFYNTTFIFHCQHFFYKIFTYFSQFYTPSIIMV